MESLLEPTPDSAWVFTAEGFDALREAIYELRFSISNGFLGLRAGRAVSRGGALGRSPPSLRRRCVRPTGPRAPHTRTRSRPRLAANPHHGSRRTARSPPCRGNFVLPDTRHEAGCLAYRMSVGRPSHHSSAREDVAPTIAKRAGNWGSGGRIKDRGRRD